ncbi:hypothetical protein [Winogradskyella sp. UBA3174]|uniref:hypothetical protein n=1 Tax=Winogradskyella sp. UBA3174 TaxID=1947785 RepID=UPI0025CDC66D|nr:hypothetical protein [Winogradskyella sp. UBA3174]|tara:strand:- start:9016 stop:9459 length:444 start_codon:yes stop_codon:yes gene_type:complete
MKKLLIIALAFFTLNGVAQGERTGNKNQKEMRQLMKYMSPEDVANLKSKKLTLKLDLDIDQQKQVHNLILEEARSKQKMRKNRETKKSENIKPTKDELVAFQNNRLDKKIELKRKMKTILTADQYAKFEKMKPRNNKKRANHGNKRN